MSESMKIIDPLQHWLEDYLPNIAGKKLKTVNNYKMAWKLFFMYMNGRGVPAENITYEMLDYDCVLGYLRWIEEDRSCKISTRNNRFAAISSFSKYSQNMDFNNSYIFRKAVLKIPFKKEIDSDERAYFTQEELKIILNLPSAKNNMGYRDHVLLEFMYASGARAEEVCTLKVGDIRFLPDGKASVCLHGKGGKKRRIKISETPTRGLQKYIQHRRIANNPDMFIFNSQRNEKMSTKCLEEVFTKYVTAARAEYPNLFQEKSYPPHSMRHTTAMHMLEAGVPLVVIKQFLGHAHLSTTEIYAKISPAGMSDRIKDWDKKYWEQYMDEPCPFEEEPSQDGIPDFLK